MLQPFTGNRRKIIIDLGNTRAKVAIFSGKELEQLEILNSPTPEQLSELAITRSNFDAGIISSVSADTLPYRNLFPTIDFIQFSSKTPIPVTNHYLTPETLGADRLAAVVAASELYPGNNVLVIDAGTAITFDFINHKNEYKGGSITAGISMRFKALHTFTGRLPLIEADLPQFLTGRTTQESILSGVINGTSAEIEGMIQKYRQLYPDLVTLITGGDMFYFEKKMKNNIFAVPNLVLYGLNLILDYNFEK